MARDLHGRIQRLERLSPYRDETDPHTLRLLAQLTRRMWKLTPELALVEACDTDRDTWRSIQEDKALMRSDWDEAVRLRRGRAGRSPSRPSTPGTAMAEAAALGERAIEGVRAKDAAIGSARLRLSGVGGSGAAPVQD